MAILTLVLFLAGLTAGLVLVQRPPEPRVSAEATSTFPPPPPTVPPAPLPPERDIPGEELPGLPRYPDSVRVGYERGERDGLAVIRARYLTTETLDTVRGFYRGVFRSEGWEEADAEFSEEEWTFHVTHGEREATVRISQLGPSVEVGIELTEPLPEETRERTTRSTPAPAPDPAPAPAPVPQYVPPAPQYAPAPPPVVPGDDYYGDDDYGDDDDFGDD